MKVDVTQVDIKELKPNPKNPRKITRTELNKLMRSLKEFGFVDPVIVNKHKERYNIIVGGHQRVQAAKKLGFKTVPVTYVDLDENKEHLLNIALNEISGEWDDEKLSELLKELAEREVDLTLTGFDEPFIDELIRSTEDDEKDRLLDIAPAAPENPKSKPGEIYLLGDHRVMCGDSTNPEDFEKLMNKQKADMCWTDPPYGVSYKGTNFEVIDNDDLRGDKLHDFLKAIYKNIFDHTKEGAAFYTCYASINHITFEQTLNEAGWTVKQQLIWEKGHVLGHSDYHWGHEPIMYCRRGETNTTWYGDRTQKTVIMNSTIEQLEDMTKEKLIEIISAIRQQSDLISESKDPVTEYLHATQKPVELIRRMLRNSSRPRELIIEPCGGSGSTLIACESTSRINYSMEIDPKYTDVILTRWANFTNKDPIRESDGKKWSEIKEAKK